MDLDITAEQEAFREEVRTWLHEHVPRDERPESPIEGRDYDLAWQRTQFDHGWAGVSWPTEYGGRGLDLLEQMIWFEEYGRAGAPQIRATFVGVNHAGPTLIERGSEEQKSFHLPKILKGELAWCQGFSEPGAGSDLAGLRTRAIVDGDELVVTGQKIWTSNADVSVYQELLVRTDPDAAKHRGITWVIGDMRLPGIDIRPIRTMSGGAELCEVFYDEVRIPLSHVVGDINDGWSVAMSTLGFERGTAFMAGQMAMAADVDQLIELARETVGPDGRRPAIADDELARRLARIRAEVAAMRAMTLATVSRAARTAIPGPEGSMVKLFYTELNKRIGELALDIIGPEAIQRSTRSDWAGHFLSTFSGTIAGGTSEIQRNIIGERVLGLPRDR